MRSEKAPTRGRIGYYILPQGLVWAAAGFMTLSFALRLAWWLACPGDVAAAGVYLHGALPLAACVLFCLCLLAPSRLSLRASLFPLLLGVAFFAAKAVDFAPWHRLGCTAMYLLMAVLYGVTAFGLLPLRRLLIPLFALPLAFHAIVLDLIVNRTVYTLPEWLQEGSVLCVMAGLLCVALAIRVESPAVQGAAP
ncbi:MAG: hypothetical protein LUG57_10555 [Oscillospiraceae bacterium]|nr:hypothetical protein [Oscillospiraceae bacterium]